jgi:cell division protein FtsB
MSIGRRLQRNRLRFGEKVPQRRACLDRRLAVLVFLSIYRVMTLKRSARDRLAGIDGYRL